jgi:hypothetical protein
VNASTGALVGTAIQFGAYIGGITTLPNGNFVATYSTIPNYYYAQIVNATNGALLGSPIQGALAALLPNGNFVATYSTSSNYYAQVVNATSGALVGNAMQFSVYAPTVTVLSNGNFLVTYSSSSNGYGQIFDSNATPISGTFEISSPPLSSIVRLSNDYLAITSTSGIQIFYVGTTLALANTNQQINYLQDKTNDLSEIAILTEYNTANATLTLSNSQAGILTTSTSGNVTSTFSPQTGIWQASGDVNEVNALLNATQFIPTPNYKGNFTVDLSVVDGGNRTANGILTLIGIPTAPVLTNSSLAITEGQSVVLTNSDLGVTPATRPVTFTMTNVNGGYFEQISNVGQSITQFTQQQIDNQQIRFVSNRTAPVSYQVSLSDGVFTLPSVPANVTFINHAPVVINSPSTQVVAVNQPFDFSFVANQIFTDADGDPLTYFAESGDGSPLPNTVHFDASQPNQLDFNGLIGTLGGTQVNLFARDPLNATAKTQFQILAQFSNSTSITNINAASQIAAPVGVALGMVVLGGGGFAFWRYLKDKKGREGHQLANFLRDSLNLKGVDNFYESENGRNYVLFVQNLIQGLQQVGIDTKTMRPGELRELANDVATVARSKVRADSDCLGRSGITVDDLNSRTQELVAGVQMERNRGTALERVHTM